ncbi:hypothetical protein E2C01_082490 [Portunus trituberculatus]|uniref:Uncharacterized protein n=1 Tax=Portunus trituberculatus TaxID=210409 RepID=A0A5B7ISH7_PORTR|nr:hypothetical protein [Portunus trituberculatus]
MMFKKALVHIIGDSMVRKTPDFLRREVECTSMGGATIQDVKKVLEEVKEMEERSLLVIQGGNNLEATGAEETVKVVIEAVKAAEDKKMSVAVVGVLQCPHEGALYENTRRDELDALQGTPEAENGVACREEGEHQLPGIRQDPGPRQALQQRWHPPQPGWKPEDGMPTG